MAEGLSLDCVTRRYPDPQSKGPGKLALDRISASIAGDEYITLLGASGAGKTVLLRVIAGFEPPDAGSLRLGAQPLNGLAAHRRGIGFVFQNFALFPHLSVRANIGFGLANRAIEPVRDPAVLRRRVDAMIELVGLGGLEARGVGQISGGQRQRVALARTLVTDPKLVLLDEPLGALDANLRLRMRGELRRIRAQLGITFLHVTGNETEALAMGDRVMVLDRGRLAQFDRPEVIYGRPASAEVAKFLNCYNIFPGRVGDGRFLAGDGAFPLDGAQPPATAAPGAPAYCIRQDLIRILPDGTETDGAAAGEAGLAVRFIASEYSGAAVTYFFASTAAPTVAVEAHLGHHRPLELQPEQPCRLVWNPADAVVFA